MSQLSSIDGVGLGDKPDKVRQIISKHRFKVGRLTSIVVTFTELLTKFKSKHSIVSNYLEMFLSCLLLQNKANLVQAEHALQCVKMLDFVESDLLSFGLEMGVS